MDYEMETYPREPRFVRRDRKRSARVRMGVDGRSLFTIEETIKRKREEARAAAKSTARRVRHAKALDHRRRYGERAAWAA